jgi:hypothetical protein
MVATAVLVLALAVPARASPGTGPVRVAVECEEEGRTKACPAFILGFIDAHPVLRSVSRASADVVLYVNSQEVALLDHIHLRFVGTVVGAPQVLEIDVDVDTRADDDGQRAQLEPAFLRGIALYVAAKHPDAVEVTLSNPHEAAAAESDTKSWDFMVTAGGNGSWTDKYQNYHGNAGLALSWLEEDARLSIGTNADEGINRQPPTIVQNADMTTTTVSTNTKQWSVSGDLEGVWLANDHWSLGGLNAFHRDDPLGQYRYMLSSRLAIEWDKYPANDPRGNRLAIAYFAGYQLEGYNLKDVLGETYAKYPIHGVGASGSIRHDQTTIGISLAVSGEMLKPSRRYSLSSSPFLQWKLGGHIDVDFSFTITQKQIVAPDETMIDPKNYYAQISRLQYAEPFSISSSLNLSIHWDRTNGLRNDRLTGM